MKTLTVKIPEKLDVRLRKKANQGHEQLSALVRRALLREVEDGSGDFAKLAAPYQGMFSGPSDLSSREGYGSQDAR